MSNVGAYLYGFTHRGCQLPAGMRGLAGQPVRALAFRDVAAVVSRHPVQHLMPLRSNLEPHHRIVRQISTEAALVPAAFGHISDTEEDILRVIGANYDDIREELQRLSRKCEMGIKLSWNVPNIFELMVRQDRALRTIRDRVFGKRQPSMNEKLEVGATFEAALGRERERVTSALLTALDPVAAEVVSTPPRRETVASQVALLIERDRLGEFQRLLADAARLFDATITLEYSGPWPPYSFVRLRLQAVRPNAAA